MFPFGSALITSSHLIPTALHTRACVPASASGMWKVVMPLASQTVTRTPGFLLYLGAAPGAEGQTARDERRGVKAGGSSFQASSEVAVAWSKH